MRYQASSTMPARSTRDAAVPTGPITGASTRMNRNEPPQMAASRSRRTRSAVFMGADRRCARAARLSGSCDRVERERLVGAAGIDAHGPEAPLDEAHAAAAIDGDHGAG